MDVDTELVLEEKLNRIILSKVNSPGMHSIPNHRELDTGLLRGLIRDAGLSVEDFLDLL